MAATPAWSSSLDQAVLKGLARHPEVAAAQAEVRAAATQVDMARNGYWPSANASAGPEGAGLGYDVTLSQTLYDWGQTRSVVDQARARLDQSQANLDVVRDDVALEIIEVYLDIASTRVQLSLLEEHLQRLGALAEMTRTRVEGRYSDQSEAGRVALALATAQGVKARLQGQLAEAMDHYDLLVDEPAEGIRLPSSPAFLRTVRDEGALEAAVATAPLYRKARTMVDAAEAGVREARAARFPRLALELSLQNRELGGRMVSDSALGLRMRMTSQQGLSALQRPQLEAERREAAAFSAEATAREVMRTVNALAAEDTALEGRITALVDQADQAGTVRDLYREQFLVGRRDIQDLVIMETEQFEAERQRMELTVERLRLQYRAAAQLGLLTPAMAGDQMAPPMEAM